MDCLKFVPSGQIMQKADGDVFEKCKNCGVRAELHEKATKSHYKIVEDKEDLSWRDKRKRVHVEVK